MGEISALLNLGKSTGVDEWLGEDVLWSASKARKDEPCSTALPNGYILAARANEIVPARPLAHRRHLM